MSKHQLTQLASKSRQQMKHLRHLLSLYMPRIGNEPFFKTESIAIFNALGKFTEEAEYGTA